MPEGLGRDSAAAAISLLPLAGLPRMMGGIQARTNEGLALRAGETPEEFQARVKDAYNARVQAEWQAKVAGSKPQKVTGSKPQDAQHKGRVDDTPQHAHRSKQMRMYRLDEAEFHLPEQAQDQSLNLFAYTHPDPLALSPAPLAAGTLPEFSLVISRAQVSADQPLEAYVTQQLQMLEQSLADFALVQRGEAYVDGLVAITLEFTWVSEQGAMRQRQAYLFCPARGGDRDAPRVALTLTATSLEKVQAQYAFTFEQILYSFTFRR